MAPLGTIDLPAEPWSLGYGRLSVPDSLQEKWQWHNVGQPTPAEIEYAVYDAQCRESSGWTDILYDAEWDMREAFVNQHRTELDTEILEPLREKAAHNVELIQRYSNY